MAWESMLYHCLRKYIIEYSGSVPFFVSHIYPNSYIIHVEEGAEANMKKANKAINRKIITLCDEKNERVSVLVTAEIRDAKLTISGVDSGKTTEEFWGDSDYEYWYCFDKENTRCREYA